MRPPSLSTSNEEPTLTTIRRKSARAGILRDMSCPIDEPSAAARVPSTADAVSSCRQPDDEKGRSPSKWKADASDRSADRSCTRDRADRGNHDSLCSPGNSARKTMSQPEQFDILVLGSGKSGKLLAWHMAQSGRRTAVIERRWIGGSCPNIACLPSKNEIWSAKVAHLARQGARFGVITGPVSIDMAAVVKRKRDMVQREIDAHLHNDKTTGAELIMGNGRFVAPKTLEVHLNDGGTRVLAGDQVFLNIGTHAAIPSVPGLEAARPLTHIEALELDYLPPHLIVLGGGYVGLELAQAYRRFGSRVTVVEPGPQLMSREDPDIADEIQRLLAGEGVEVVTNAQTLRGDGRSGENVSVAIRTPSGERKVEGSDILVAAGRVPNTAGIGLDE